MSYDGMTDHEALEHIRADVVLAQAARYEEECKRLVKAREELKATEVKVGLLKAAVEQSTRERDRWHAKVRQTIREARNDPTGDATTRTPQEATSCGSGGNEGDGRGTE